MARTEVMTMPVAESGIGRRGSRLDSELRKQEEVTQNVNSKSVRGGVLSASTQALKMAAQLVSTVILARLLTPSDFGLVAMVGAITGFMMVFRDAGLSTATIQSQTIDRVQVSNLFWINTSIGAVLMTLLVACSPLIAAMLGDQRLILVCVVLSSTFLIGGIATQHQALLQRNMQFTQICMIDCCSTLLAYGIALLIGYTTRSYWALVAIPVVQAAVMAVGVLLAGGWLPAMPRKSAEMRGVLQFGGGITIGNIATAVARNLDNVLIGWMWGAEALGYYSRAYALLLLPLRQVDSVLSAVAIPAMSRLQQSEDKLIDFVEKVQLLSICLFVPPICIIVVFAESVIGVLLGDQWSEVTAIFQLLGCVAIAQTLIRFSGWMLVTAGKGSAVAYLSVLGAALAAAAFLVGVRFGAYGVAAALLVETVVWSPVIVWLTLRSVKLEHAWTRFFPTTGLACVLITVALSIAAVAISQVYELGHFATLGLATLCLTAGYASLLTRQGIRDDLRNFVRQFATKTT